MVAWPNTIPQDFEVENARIVTSADLIGFQPEVGPPMQRRRGNAAPEIFTGTLLMTLTEWGLFDDWFRSDALNGAASFTWKHPLRGSAATVLIVAQPDATLVDHNLLKLTLTIAVLR